MEATTAEYSVTTVPTPNPNALMFRVQEALVPTGTYEYTPSDDTAGSPLAQELFQLEGIELVLVAPRFVTVNKRDATPWPDLVPAIKDTLRDFLRSGRMAVLEEQGSNSADAVANGELEQRILAFLDEEVRPAVAQDGGDVAFVALTEGIVHLRMHGACGSCPSSATTLKMGIERLMLEAFPEITGVEQAF